jgi:predicted nucleotidyltransferase
MEERDLRGAAWGPLPDCPADVEDLLRELLDRLTANLGDAVQAVYLYGSLVFGDFDADVSDVDLLVVMASDVDDRQLARLAELHDAFAREHPAWRDRIEAVYISASALRGFREGESPLVVISPGEPLHRTRTTRGWVANWHLVRERGVALYGPEPDAIIPPTRHDDFEAAIRTYLPELPPRAEASRDPRVWAYAVLTVCRALYSCRERRQISKPQAGHWAARHYPEWSDTIQRAQAWRRGAAEESDAARRRALAFVRFGVERVGRAPSEGRSP